jgi:hypothetical protein
MQIKPLGQSDPRVFPPAKYRLRWFLNLTSGERVYSGWSHDYPSWSQTWAEYQGRISGVGIETESVESRTIETVFSCDLSEFSGELGYFGAHKGSVKVGEDGKSIPGELTNYHVFAIYVVTTCKNRVIVFHDGSVAIEEANTCHS